MLNIVNKKILNSDSGPENIQINSTRVCTMNVYKAQQDRNTKSRVPFLADLRNEEKQAIKHTNYSKMRLTAQYCNTSPPKSACAMLCAYHSHKSNIILFS